MDFALTSPQPCERSPTKHKFAACGIKNPVELKTLKKS
jgi:hypothetical protein